MPQRLWTRSLKFKQRVIYNYERCCGSGNTSCREAVIDNSPDISVPWRCHNVSTRHTHGTHSRTSSRYSLLENQWTLSVLKKRQCECIVQYLIDSIRQYDQYLIDTIQYNTNSLFHGNGMVQYIVNRVFNIMLWVCYQSLRRPQKWIKTVSKNTSIKVI